MDSYQNVSKERDQLKRSVSHYQNVMPSTENELKLLREETKKKDAIIQQLT